MKKREHGFTLIELLVVVAIIAILALVVLLAINPVEMARKSRDSRRLSDLGTVRRAIDLSLADGKTLPGAPGNVFSKTSVAGNLTAADAANNFVGMDVSKYISVLPSDPSYAAGDATTMQTTTGVCPNGTAQTQKQNMVYTFRSNGSVYSLSGSLESTDNCAIPSNDGGQNAALYELGTAPAMLVN